MFLCISCKTAALIQQANAVHEQELNRKRLHLASTKNKCLINTIEKRGKTPKWGSDQMGKDSSSSNENTE